MGSQWRRRPPFILSNMSDCIAFWNHSKNSSSVMHSSILDAGIRHPLCPEELDPFPVLCLVVTWKLGLWVLGGHLIPCNKNSALEKTPFLAPTCRCRNSACDFHDKQYSISFHIPTLYHLLDDSLAKTIYLWLSWVLNSTMNLFSTLDSVIVFLCLRADVFLPDGKCSYL